MSTGQMFTQKDISQKEILANKIFAEKEILPNNIFLFFIGAQGILGFKIMFDLKVLWISIFNDIISDLLISMKILGNYDKIKKKQINGFCHQSNFILFLLEFCSNNCIETFNLSTLKSRDVCVCVCPSVTHWP